MKAKMLMLAAALLLFAATSFGQGFVVFPFESDQTLTTLCDGTTPIPDGVMFYLFQDANGNGPDAADVLATLCLDPPLCSEGQTGSLNFNQQPMNGEVLGLGAGHFFPDYGFVSMGALPTVNRFFIRVYWPSMAAPQTVWTSVVFSPVVGYSEIELSGWVCEAVGPGPCVQTPEVTLVPTTQVPMDPQTTPPVCATLCPDEVMTLIHVGPVAGANRVPHITVTPGCDGCDPAGAWVVGDWTFADNMFTATIDAEAGAVGGCVTITLDYVEPVGMGDVAITPMDGKVKVAWFTNSESDVNRFEISRDGAVVASKEGTNTPARADYEYVDSDVQNGHSYKYELAVVYMNGSREVVHSESVVPSFDLAVVTEYALHQNFPNPFNPTTTIAFDLVNDNPVTLTVYNAAGQLVSTVMNNRTMSKGRHTITFDATNMTSGLYFYTVKIGNEFTSTKKMLLVK